VGLILDSTVFIDAERRGRTVVATLERLQALELGFAIATGNPRHLRLVPGLRVHVVR
jgi:hypothetical protein